ncbi:uncharacterized protein [Ambystoma mexicanum]|uniref:uncharacterized protein n=1 Tax=Ambystoma mexicanum TaxID=8296 RepID=UPI0037E76E53
MRTGTSGNFLLCLSLLVSCCLYSSAAPTESGRSLLHGKRSIDFDFSEGHQGKRKNARKVQKESRNASFKITITRKPVKKRMLSPVMPFDAEPIKTLIHFIIRQNASGMVGSVSNNARDRNVLSTLPIQESLRENVTLQTNKNRSHRPANFFWPTDAYFLKGLLKGQKNASNSNNTGNVGEVAIINIKILEIPKSTKSSRLNLTTVGSSTESFVQPVVSSETSQTYFERTTEKSNMNIALPEFTDLLTIINDLDRKFTWFMEDEYKNNLQEKFILEMKRIKNAIKRLDRRKKHEIITFSDSNIKKVLQRLENKMAISPTQSTLATVRNYNLFAGVSANYPHKQEEHIRIRSAMKRLAKLIRQLATASAVSIYPVIAANYSLFTREMPPNPKEQMNTMDNYSDERRLMMPEGNYDLSNEVTISHQNKDEEQMTNEADRHTTWDTSSEGKTLSVSPGNYELSSEVMGTGQNTQEGQRKIAMKNRARKRNTRLHTFSEASIPTASVENYFVHMDGINTNLFKEGEQKKYTLDTLSESRRPKVSVENYYVNLEGSSITPYKHRKQMKHAINSFSEEHSLMVSEDDLANRTTDYSPEKDETEMKNPTESTDRNGENVLEAFSFGIHDSTNEVKVTDQNKPEKTRNAKDSMVRKMNIPLDTLSGGNKPPVSVENYYVFHEDINTSPYKRGEQMTNKMSTFSEDRSLLVSDDLSHDTKNHYSNENKDYLNNENETVDQRGNNLLNTFTDGRRLTIYVRNYDSPNDVIGTDKNKQEGKTRHAMKRAGRRKNNPLYTIPEGRRPLLTVESFYVFHKGNSTSPDQRRKPEKNTINTLSWEKSLLVSVNVSSGIIYTYPKKNMEQVKYEMETSDRKGANILDSFTEGRRLLLSIGRYNATNVVMITDQNKSEGETKYAMKRMTRRKNTPLHAVSESSRPTLSVGNYYVFNKEIGTTPYKQEGQMENSMSTFSEETSLRVTVKDLSNGFMDPHRHNDEEQMQNAMERIAKLIRQLATVSAVRSPAVTAENYQKFTGVMMPYSNEHEKQVKNTTDTMSNARRLLVSEGDYDLSNEVIGTNTNRDAEQMMNAMRNIDRRQENLLDTSSEGLILSLSVGSYELSTEIKGIDQNKQQETTKNVTGSVTRRKNIPLQNFSEHSRPAVSVENYVLHEGISTSSYNQGEQMKHTVDIFPEERSLLLSVEVSSKEVMDSNPNLDEEQVTNAAESFDRKAESVLDSFTEESLLISDGSYRSSNEVMGADQNKPEEQMKVLFGSMAKRRNSPLDTFSEGRSLPVSVDNYYVFNGGTRTSSNKQEQISSGIESMARARTHTLDIFSDHRSPAVRFGNYNLAEELIGSYPSIKDDRKNNHIFDTSAEGRSTILPPENYDTFSLTIGTYSNKLQKQVKETVQTTGGKTLMDSGRNLLMSVGNFNVSNEVIETYLNTDEEQVKTTIKITPKPSVRTLINPLFFKTGNIGSGALIPISNVPSEKRKLTVESTDGERNTMYTYSEVNDPNQEEAQLPNGMKTFAKSGKKLFDIFSNMRNPLLSMDNYDLLSILSTVPNVQVNELNHKESIGRRKSNNDANFLDSRNTAVPFVHYTFLSEASGTFPNSQAENTNSNEKTMKSTNVQDALSENTNANEKTMESTNVQDALSENTSPWMSTKKYDLFMDTYPNTKELYRVLQDEQNNQTDIINKYLEAFMAQANHKLLLEKNKWQELKAFFNKPYTALKKIPQNVQNDMQALILQNLLNELVIRIKQFLKKTPYQGTHSTTITEVMPTIDYRTTKRSFDFTVNGATGNDNSPNKNSMSPEFTVTIRLSSAVTNMNKGKEFKYLLSLIAPFLPPNSTKKKS